MIMTPKFLTRTGEIVLITAGLRLFLIGYWVWERWI